MGHQYLVRFHHKIFRQPGFLIVSKHPFKQESLIEILPVCSYSRGERTPQDWRMRSAEILTIAQKVLEVGMKWSRIVVDSPAILRIASQHFVAAFAR